jgi:UV excision repair protein RAD23
MAETAETDIQSAEITFKTITQEVFKLTLPLTTNIGDIKARIFKDKGGDFEIDRQKLIYNGKVLEDSQTLGDIKVDEKKYIVVMASRKKVEQPVVSQSSSSSTATAQPSTPANTTESATGSSSVNAPAPVNPTPSLTPEQEETITTVCAMGYERDQVIKALRAAFWNAERAIEYLCTGIPETVEPAAEEENQADVSMDASGDEDDPLVFLRDSPQFAQIAQLVRSAPEMLPQVLEQIAASNPELMQTIRNNQEAFVQMLNQGVTGEQQSVEEAGQPPHQAGHLTIAVTEADRNAIQRLQAMGFAEQLVIEAYFACDKNEDLAVNYILSRMEEPADDTD